MSKIKFIHTADLHLDTPFKGLSNLNQELADKLKDATFKSFKRIIDLCISENVDFLIISGDIFNSEDQSISAQLKFIAQLKRLTLKGIQAYFVCGNHDPLSSWLDSLEFPEGVIRFNSKKIESANYQKDGETVAKIYGTSFHNKATKDNLAAKFELENETVPVSIAVLHGSIGNADSHENYAPFKFDDVENKGFDYWALGHIHKRNIVNKSHPAIVYPGNPQGRDFAETGPKGCFFVELMDGGVPEIRFESTQLIHFEEVAIDVTGESKINKLTSIIDDELTKLKDKNNDSSSYIIRITLNGRTSLHSQLKKVGEMEQLTEDFNEGELSKDNFIWIDQMNLKTSPDVDIDQLKKGNDFTAEILNIISRHEEGLEAYEQLIEDVSEELSNKVRRELYELKEQEKNEILEDSKWKLIEELTNTKK